jgi:glycosyltransferase involved in cell wall biosynthesis
MTAKPKLYSVVLFQSHLRQFVLNFERYLPNFSFQKVSSEQTGRTVYAEALTIEREVRRNKLTLRNRLRRFLGVPNVRLWLREDGDILFTYGCLIITRKPYCTYLETGLTLYNYDPGIAKNSIARLIVSYLATRPNCQGLIFLSEASRKSFFATVRYHSRVKKILEAKSSVIHPIPIDRPKNIQGKGPPKNIKLLFVGLFYIKGGLELAHAYERLRSRHPNLSLTIVTKLKLIWEKDLSYLQSLPGLSLVDAALSAAEMDQTYRTHDIFVLPTMREGYGLVLVEAIAYGLAVITTDQFATSEMVTDQNNGFVFYNHPLLDYDPHTYSIKGQYYNARDLYAALFSKQQTGSMRRMEDWLAKSIAKYIDDPQLLAKHSQASLELYQEKFDPVKLGKKLEKVFLRAVTH